MEVYDYMQKSMALGSGVVGHLQKDQLQNKTPCTEWDVHELLNHMINEIMWLDPLLSGRTIADVGSSLDGDLVGENPLNSWQAACKKAGGTCSEVKDWGKVVELSYGKVPTRDYIHEVASDILVHSWDLAQGLNTSLIIDNELVEEALAHYKPRADWLGDGKYFQKPLAPAAGDSSLSELLKMLGRSPQWEASI